MILNFFIRCIPVLAGAFSLLIVVMFIAVMDRGVVLADGANNPGQPATQNPLIINQAPTIGTGGTYLVGFGSTASVTGSNGSAAFSINVGTSSAVTGAVQMPAAPNAWLCFVEDLNKAVSGTNLFASRQISPASGLGPPTTTVEVEGFLQGTGASAWGNNDVLNFLCLAR